MSTFVGHMVPYGDEDAPARWLPVQRDSVTFSSVEAALTACERHARRTGRSRPTNWLPLDGGQRHRSRPHNGDSYQITRTP